MQQLNSFRSLLPCILLCFFTSAIWATPCGQFRTQTQGGWGATPNGNNPGAYLHRNFTSVFPNGLTLGCSNKITLTTAQSVSDFLPSGGTASALPNGMKINPGNKYKNVLAGQIAALKLSVSFDKFDTNFGNSDVLLENLTIVSGKFAGKSVAFVLQEGEKILGGCVSSYTAADLNEAATLINENFDNGTTDKGFLTCPTKINPCDIDKTPPTITNCPPSITVNTYNNCATTTWTEPGATDEFSNAVLWKNYSTTTCFPTGTTNVIYTATDACGNTSTCSFTVTVRTLVIDNPIKKSIGQIEAVAYTSKEKAHIDWVSTVESSEVIYTVQKLIDGQYIDVHQLNTNNAKGMQSFTYSDVDLPEGITTYRIKAQSFDGNILYSQPQQVKHINKNKISVFPNPANDQMEVNLSKYNDVVVDIWLTNSFGQIIKKVSTKGVKGEVYQMDLSNVPSGSYFLTVLDVDKDKPETVFVRVEK